MAKEDVLTEEDKRESIKNDINFNMFVEAGAGAGKTTILIDRIINQFKSGEYKPENIVAITFTKKAAEELKGRMVKCLRKVSNEETDEKKKEYLKDALMNLDKMQLSTIHSFCFKLLMERAFDARLRMDVSMLEEGDVDQDKKDYFSKWFKSNEKSLEEYIELANLDIWKYYDLSFSAFSMMVDLPLDVIIEINKNVLKKKFKDLPAVYQKEKDGSIKVNDYGNPLEDSKSQEYKDRKEYQSNFIINYVIPAVEGYRKIHNSHYISNDKLLLQSRDLLYDNEEARNYFRKKYKTLYVDEFQDTDKVQVDLVFALCGDDKDGLRDGSLFVVGDPKQSIYRFRGADVPLYLAVKEKMTKLKNTKVYELNYNYRTHKDVLDFVNYNAKRNLKSYTEMMSMSKSNKCNDKKQFKGIYHIGKPSADKIYNETKISEKIEGSDKGTYNKDVEKKYLSAIINGLVNSNAVIFDKNLNGDKGGTRSIQYKDFLILCRTKSNMDLYMDHMMKNGIPVQISSYVDISSNSYFKRLKDIYGLFSYPYDRKIKEAFAQAHYDKVFIKEEYNDIKIVIKNIYDKTKMMDAYTKLLYISHNLDLYNDNHKNIRKDILKRIETQVEQMVENVISTCANNVQDIYDGITNFVENGYEREIALENDVDAVRFMNIHKAKGLEGKIVIVCQRYEKSNDELSSIHINDKDGLMHYYISLTEIKGHGNKVYYPSYYNNEELVEKAICEQNDEMNRLAYVECTRPMEAIIFMEYRNKNDMFENYDFSMAKYLFADDEYPEIKAELEKTQVEPENAIEYKRNEFLLDKNDSQYEYTFKKDSPSSLEQYGNVTNKIIDDAEVKAEKVEKPALRGAVYGTTMHRAFELYFNYKKENGNLDGKKVLEIANKAIIESLSAIKEEYADNYEKTIKLFQNEIVNDIETIMTNDNIKNLVKDAKTYYTEYPFTYKDEKGNLINGKADLIFEKNDGTITIVDYKSDYNPGLEKDKFAEMLDSRYKGQLELYKKSFAKIYDIDESKIKVFIYNKYKGE